MGITILCRARFSLCTVWLFSKRITAELPPSGKLHWIWLTPLESWWPVCKDPRQRLGKPEASKGVTEIRCTHLWSVCRPPGEMLSRGAGGISISIHWTTREGLGSCIENEIALVAPWGNCQMTKENGPHRRRLDHWALWQQQRAMTTSKQTFDPGTRIIPGNSWHIVCQLYTAPFLTSDLHQVRTPYTPFVVVCPSCTHLGALRPPQSTDLLHPCQDYTTRT